MQSEHLNITAAVVLAGGGVAGYLKAKSVPSLAAGVGSAAILGTTVSFVNTVHCLPHTRLLQARYSGTRYMLWK